MYISAAVEGTTDDAAVRRVLAHCGIEPGPIHVRGGKPAVLDKIDGYRRASEHGPWLVLMDLDADHSCAPSALEGLGMNPTESFHLRFAVHQLEAWLLADRSNLAQFLRVRQAHLPDDPEAVADAKQALVNSARSSTSSRVKAEMIPVARSGRNVGAGYTSRLIEFINQHWDINAASQRADSLARMIERLREANV